MRHRHDDLLQEPSWFWDWVMFIGVTSFFGGLAVWLSYLSIVKPFQ